MPSLMGVLNVTPDSFSDGGRFIELDRAVEQGLRLRDEGADVIDIGGESTRPGALPVSAEEEQDRVLPIIMALAREGVRLSIDSRHAGTQRAAIEAGAAIINDVSALSHDRESAATAAALGVPVILMHAQGTPRTMQNNPRYHDVMAEITGYLTERVDAALAAGIERRQIILDPGIGFGKSLEHNLEIFRRLGLLRALGLPILIGASRKRFIAALDRDGPADQRLGGSVAAAIAAADAGAAWLRVHDVAATRQALTVWQALRNSA